MSAFPSLDHIAVTVSDLSVSAPWYRRLFDAEPALDEDTGVYHHVVFRAGTTLFSLHTFPDGVPAGDRFDERRLGLDHVSFGCEDREAVEKFQRRLDDLGIAHSGIVEAQYGSVLSFRDPDGIALEFFARRA
jgi:glyoxylase I family protein